MSKNILIATWYGPANYGTALQAIALKHYLECQGYSVKFLEDLRNTYPRKRESSDNTRLTKLKKLGSKEFWFKLPYRNQFSEKAKLNSTYMSAYVNTFQIRTNSDIESVNEETDVFISGGDQIWNPYVFTKGFMLDFVDEKKPKISYGTSVGVQCIPAEKEEIYIKYLSRYHKISVREEQSAKALQPILGREVDVVLDPTMLLDDKDWGFLLNNSVIKQERFNRPYILCYFVGTRNTYWDYVDKVKKATGYDVIVIPINDAAYINKYKKYVAVSPSEFLWLIKNAQIVCTDSFHATVFSLLYKKEFYTLKRFVDSSKESQNGRLENLLKRYNLENRLVMDESIFRRMGNIDYDQIHLVIKDERNKSKQWLENALSK